MTCHMSFTALTCRPFISPQALVPRWPSLDPAFGLVTNCFLVRHLYLLHPTVRTVHLVMQSDEWRGHRNHLLATVTSIKDLK